MLLPPKLKSSPLKNDGTGRRSGFLLVPGNIFQGRTASGVNCVRSVPLIGLAPFPGCQSPPGFFACLGDRES